MCGPIPQACCHGAGSSASARVAPSPLLLALADGGYVIADGPGVVSGKTVTFATAADGSCTMAIEAFEPATWLTGD